MATGIKMENAMLSKTSQTQKDKQCVISLTYRIFLKKFQLTVTDRRIEAGDWDRDKQIGKKWS